MGRVTRMRKRRKNRTSTTVSINREKNYLELIEWMKEHGWKPTCKLVSAYFENTGRGFMAKEQILPGAAIVKIPYELLITVKTVAESQIRSFFPSTKAFMTQQVLSSFLLWESHLGDLSKWSSYINCLPRSFSCPAYCANVSWMPQYLREKVEEMKNIIRRTYENITENIDSTVCAHCGTLIKSIFDFDLYVWAWCIVSTRAVYLCPSYNKQDSISLSDENNLALAPYIDLFNHDFNTEVKAYVVESEGIYQIETLKSFKKNDEVFINYGPLSNDRLFIHYGFINPLNVQDSISFTYEEILSAVDALVPSNKHINEYRRRFLQNKKMFNNISCHASGLSWDFQALIYVFICSADMKIEEIKQNIFSDKFKLHSREAVSRIAESIVQTKCAEFEKQLQNLLENHREAERQYPECYAVVRELLREHIKLLKKCRVSLILKTVDY